MQEKIPKKSGGANCETCEFYDYNEYDDVYCCTMRLDEDDRIRYLHRDTFSCPYYRYYDEYTSVHKQI